MEAAVERESSSTRKREARFSTSFIERLRPDDVAFELADTTHPGLRMRVLPSGAKVFRWYVNSLGRVITLGRWAAARTPGHVTFAEACEWLARLKAARLGGESELARVEAELRALLRPDQKPAPAAGPRSFEAWAETWLERLQHQRKRPEVARYIMKKDVLPVIGSKTLEQLQKSDCRAVVERVVKRKAYVHAGKVLATLKQFLSFIENVDDDFISPASRLKGENLGTKTHQEGNRALREEKELIAFWNACETGESRDYLPPEEAFRAALQLLLLTGVRTGELRQARWADVDLERRLWTIPVEHQKVGIEAFVVPLTPTAAALFGRLKHLAGESAYVLPATRLRRAGVTPKSATIDDKTLAKAMARMWRQHPALAKLESASPHDLRRTCSTWLGNLQVLPHIVELCLNHSIGRIARTYNKATVLEDRRAALEKWDAFLAGLTRER